MFFVVNRQWHKHTRQTWRQADLRLTRGGGGGAMLSCPVLVRFFSVVFIVSAPFGCAARLPCWFQGWLRNLFRGQAVFTGLASYALASNNVPGVAEVDLPLRALGFWSWWLLTIPSLRAIKPLEPQEKSALDWAFVGTLLASLLVPFATKDPGQIWAVDAAVVAACYGASYALGEPEPEEAARPADKERKAPDGPAVKALKEFGAFASTALDFGSGRERGTVETVNKTALEKLLEERVKEKVDETAGEDAE